MAPSFQQKKLQFLQKLGTPVFVKRMESYDHEEGSIVSQVSETRLPAYRSAANMYVDRNKRIRTASPGR